MEVEREILISVQLHKFKNIELFKQGIYQIRIRLLYERDNKIIFAEPFKIWSNTIREASAGCTHLLPAHISDDYSCFNSRGVLVRYQDETINFLESCVFSCKIPDSLRTFPVKILADLYFTNLESKKKSTSKLRILERRPSFHCVVNKEYLITNVFSSMSHYLPMSFDPKFFCSLESVVHVYTIRYVNLSVSLKSQLFGDSSLVGGSKVDRIYFSMVDPLFISYNQIRKLYKELDDIKKLDDLEESVENDLLLLTAKNRDKASFFELIGTHEAGEVAKKLIAGLDQLSELIKLALDKLFQQSLSNSAKVTSVLKRKFEKEVWAHFQEYIQIDDISINSLFYEDQHRRTSHAFAIRENAYFNNLEVLPLQAEDLYSANICHPIFFIHSNPQHIKHLVDDTQSKPMDIHAIFLVHGYQGSSVDMHMIKGYINMIYPTVHTYSSRANENFTDCDINVLGENLAEEVLHHLYEIKVPKSRLRISFIGHSQGGLIIRAALPGLVDYKACMHSIVTLSSPHVGIVYAGNSLLKFGKWVLKKLQKSVSFLQMIMKDNKNFNECFLYKLSTSDGLDWFQHVVLFICSDDPYVPVDSAGMFVPSKCVGTKKEGLFTELVRNILAKVDEKKFVRIDVNFKHKQLLDHCVCCGNRHIDFLDDPCFIKMLCYSMPKLFL